MIDRQNELRAAISNAKDKIEEIKREQLQPAEYELKRLEQELADELCPFEIGDVIERHDGVRGRIARVVLFHHGGFYLKVWKLRKNGKTWDKNTTRWISWDVQGWEKCKVISE